jgi:hypothetical protein
MMLIRAFEEKNAALQAEGKAPGTCTSVGQEASAVGVVRALEMRDRILTNHRSAGHLLARGADPGRMMAEIAGKRTGYCKGKSGTLHISVSDLGVILTSTIVGYSYMVEFFCAWYGPSKYERDMFWWRFTGHFWWAAWIMFTCNVILPLSLWFKRVRRNLPVLFVLMLFVNVGMWFERFVIIVTSLARSFEPYTWGVNYRISWTELAVTAGAFAWFFMFFLVFVKVLPAFSIAELKETLPVPKRRKP